jgi:hypothetical protein
MPSNGCGYPPTELGRRRSLRAVASAAFERILARERPVGAVDHPLDFICIPLVRTRLAGVCGHVWSSSGGALAIHAHSWHLYSEVVLGAIANEVFRVVGQADGDYHVVRVRTTDRTDLLTPTGATARVVDKTTEVCRVGGAYTLRPDTFHRSTPLAEGLTLTLVQATMLAGHHDQILLPSPRRAEATQRRQLSEYKALALVTAFKDAVDAGRRDAGEASRA